PTEQGHTGRGSLAAGRVPPFGRVRPPRRPALPGRTAQVHSTAALTMAHGSRRAGAAGARWGGWPRKVPTFGNRCARVLLWGAVAGCWGSLLGTRRDRGGTAVGPAAASHRGTLDLLHDLWSACR